MKAFIYAMRGRLLCTACSLAFLAWYNFCPVGHPAPEASTEAAQHAQ